MALAVKICGITSPEAVAAAAEGGAAFVGLVFYPPSPRYLTLERAAALAAGAPGSVGKVAVLVDPEDARVAEIVERVPVDALQLHGDETPRRVADLKARFGLPVMKAVKLAAAEDLETASAYAEVADWLMFDAKPPKDGGAVLPGGNALAFDWRLLQGRGWPRPWMLSGGLTAESLPEAVRISGAEAVDVSSGVEDRPGHKDPARIAAFLRVAATL